MHLIAEIVQQGPLKNLCVFCTRVLDQDMKKVLSFWTDIPLQSLIRVYTNCQSDSTFWTNFSMERPLCLNICLIIENILGVCKFRTFMVGFTIESPFVTFVPLV